MVAVVLVILAAMVEVRVILATMAPVGAITLDGRVNGEAKTLGIVEKPMKNATIEMTIDGIVGMVADGLRQMVIISTGLKAERVMNVKIVKIVSGIVITMDVGSMKTTMEMEMASGWA